ncbi:MAG: CehA/McbA family metallohydrolase [Planctomycetes bacterium]|nr:CehA/McbA family metallohydrolase [Planctomycetota bacterium]
MTLISVAVAAAAFLSGESPFPIHLLEKSVHLGDNEVKDLEPSKPLALAWSTSFDVEKPAVRHLIVIEARHVVANSNGDYRKGGFRDVVFVNDREVGTLNDSVEREDTAPCRVEVAIPDGVVRRGTNTIRIVAGASGENHDDFTIAKVRLYALVPVVVKAHEKKASQAYPITLVFESSDGESDPILGPAYRASGARSVVIDTTGETTAWLRSPGAFRVWAMRGLEYTAPSAAFSTVAGAPPPIDLEIERAFDPPGQVGADFHLHSVGSPDSQIVFEDRVRACAAAGLEFIVATEHNNVVDLMPAIRKLGYESRLRATSGDEITTKNPNIGHFNLFPLVPDTTKPQNGAAPFEGLKPADLAENARALGRPTVLQINHPRLGDIGYFNLFRLEFAGTDGAGRTALAGFSTQFDAIEVLNGDESIEGVKRVLSDWWKLLDEGLALTATGNSDSHKIVFQEAGWPRNYVRVGTDDPAAVRTDDIVAAVRAHRVSVSHGPVIRLLVGGKDAIGDEITRKDGKLDVRVQVDAAPWVHVDRVDVVVNDAVAASMDVPFSRDVRRLDHTFSLTLERDAWVVVVAEGSGFDAPARLRHDIPPFAFTNPIWVDVDGRDRDGDGRLFDAPGLVK